MKSTVTLVLQATREEIPAGKVPLGVEADLLCVQARVGQLEEFVAWMRERLSEHRRLTGASSRRLERALAEFDVELAEVRSWLDGV